MPSRVQAGDNLPDAVYRSQRAANPRVIGSLAGRTRQRYERATGDNPVPNEGPATPLNPQAMLGHDHSGPPWGAAFLHPVAVLLGLPSSFDSDIQSGYFESKVGIAGSTTRTCGPWLIWQRPFAQLPAPSVAPYSRLYLYLRAMTDAGTSDLTVTLRARPLNGAPFPVRQSEIGTVTTTDTAFAKEDAYVDMVPGYNVVQLQFAGSHESNEISIIEASLCQAVKLSH
jgi:hypothetical protein